MADHESIWLIEETTFTAEDWGREAHTAVDTDYGYFTFEAAQETCNRLNAEQESRYRADVTEILRRNTETMKRNNEKTEDWKTRVAASSRPMNPPWMDQLRHVPTWEEWSRHDAHEYQPVEVKPGQSESDPDPEPDKPGDCDCCGMTYDSCTKRILSGHSACCPSCANTEHHPGMNTWEAWDRRRRHV